MLIGLDLRCLPNDGSDGSGVAHAARALCLQLMQDESVEWKAFVPRGAVFTLSVILAKAGIQYNEIDSNESLRLRQKDDKKKVVELSDNSSKSLRRALKQNPCDILFVPSGAISPGLGVTAVPWVHDLTIFDHPEWFPQSWLKRQITTRFFLRGIKRAPVVFAISEYTKRAIVRIANIPESRVVVTYEGGDETLRLIKNYELRIKNSNQNSSKEYCQKKWGIKSPFILALGTVEPRKNLAMLIRAWKAALNPLRAEPSGQERGVCLAIAGRDGWKFEDVNREIRNLKSDEASRFYRIKDFNDEDKRQLLLAADAVAIPSLDEGFGLVVLEAMQAGTRVIASDRGALPEVVGDAGLLIDPTDEGGWTKALAQMTNAKCQMPNESWDEKFSWEKTAQVILESLKKI
ncbi:MAG: glycosyltransferase family 1 protein [Patescibacteria group bacterium]|nr:glycosyltransferase family 1 protein [Patescibacteria group bacterium]